VVHAAEEQKEEIMAKFIELHETLQQLQIHTVSQATMQQPEKTQQPPAQKEKYDTVQIVVQSRDTFMVTRQMVIVDQVSMQKPMGDIDHFEVVIMHIPTKALCKIWASIMLEVQSRAHTDATNLEVGRGVT
jgi:hypothetical protein